MRFNYLFFILIFITLSGFVFAESELHVLARTAVTGNAQESATAVTALRSEKQAGLDAVFESYREVIESFTKTGIKPEGWNRIASVLDRVAMQKDAYSARLYWHTDFNRAKQEAVLRKKPILSLRLLGGLNEEYSCANSRFFRSILYSDPVISKNLRENYVLHWKSVRPAPKITIDFGDGRKLVRTITGNSIHYITSNTGHIYDALPGLYDPDTFNRYLTELRNLIKNGDARGGEANGYRLRKGQHLAEEWESRLESLGKAPNVVKPASDSAVMLEIDVPTALDAAPRAVTKSAVEMPAVLALMPQIEKLKVNTDINDWKGFAKQGPPVRFSKESLSLIRSKSGSITDDEFARLVRNLKEYVAIDTVQNEYRFHLEIMSWINSLTNVEILNKRIYSKLFLTPDSDKWLGLYAPDIYSAIENNGIIR